MAHVLAGVVRAVAAIGLMRSATGEPSEWGDRAQTLLSSLLSLPNSGVGASNPFLKQVQAGRGSQASAIEVGLELLGIGDSVYGELAKPSSFTAALFGVVSATALVLDRLGDGVDLDRTDAVVVLLVFGWACYDLLPASPGFVDEATRLGDELLHVRSGSWLSQTVDARLANQIRVKLAPAMELMLAWLSGAAEAA